MRVRSIALCSASIAVLAAAIPARAQTAPSDQPAVAATGTPSGASNGTPAGDVDAAGTDIVVTGLRRSLESAQRIKRDSPQQIDSIVASDIGKLPDVAISDTAARIPGVQVDRGGGEASRVLIRGLPDFATTYNGREIFTAEARSVALQDFPAGGIAALEIFKTTTADLVEGGLGGEVNVRSRKPFDFEGLEVAGSLWGQYEKRSKHKDPNGDLLLSDRWDTGMGEIGALINFSYTRLRYLDSTRSNTDFIAGNVGGTGANFPDIQRVDYGQGDRTRPSLNGALQWRPSPGLEFYAEALWQGFRNKVSDREYSVPLYAGENYSNLVFDQDSGRLVSGTITRSGGDGIRPDGFQGATYGKTDTYQYAVGGKYDAGPLNISADVAHTKSRFLDSVYSFDTAFRNPVGTTRTIDFNTGVGGLGDGPAVSLPGTDFSDPNTFVYRGFYDRQLIARGKDWQGRLDFSYDTGLDFLPKIEAGVRYVDRDAHFEDGSRYNPREGDQLPLSAIPGVEYHVFHSGFPGNDPSGIRGYYTPTYASIRDAIDDLRTFSGFAAGPPPNDPSVTYSANEKSYAAYGQINYAFGTGIRVNGSIGLRAVKTKLSIDGTNRIRGANGAPDTFEPTTVGKEYTDFLPNASARVRFTDELQLRLSYTQTRTRPGFGQYNPGFTVDPTSSGGGPRNASGGNPNLNPINSTNYDASLEYYFTRNGFVSVALFRRDLRGFIQNFTQLVDDPEFGSIQLNQPYNTGKGRIQGFEGQATSFLDADFLPNWLHAFGFDANVTYLDAKTGFPASLGGAVTQSPIIGVSKWAYNLNAFYEKDGLSARISWNHRGAFPSRFEARGGDTYSEETHGIGRLDFSGSYDLFKNLTLTADWTNILAKPYRSDLTYDYANGTSASFPRAIRYEESVYSLGVRFRF